MLSGGIDLTSKEIRMKQKELLQMVDFLAEKNKKDMPSKHIEKTNSHKKQIKCLTCNG
jgi:hypothetical protein